MDIKIKDLSIGDSAQIFGYELEDKIYREKLLSMGLTKGTILKLIKIAPLGDPVEIEIRGFNLSLRKKEADILKIKRLSVNEHCE